MFRHKKGVLIFMVILLTAVVYFVFFRNKETLVYEHKNAPLASSNLSNKNLIKDTDNDGLRDWEEALWKTDPNNPDTDADGTKDGQEIKENRNPLKKGPGDIITKESSPEKQEGSEPETITELFGQHVLSELLINNQLDTGLTEEKKNEIANSLLVTLETLAQPKSDLYQLEDLPIISSNEKQRIKQYGNEFGYLVKKYFDPIPESELVILNKIMTDQNEKGLEKLNELSLAYQTVSQKMIDIEVSAVISENHLVIANTFSHIAEEINDMQKTFTDPALVLIALKQYQDSSQKAYEALKNINNYFFNNGIIFNEGEPGKLFEIYK